MNTLTYSPANTMVVKELVMRMAFGLCLFLTCFAPLHAEDAIKSEDPQLGRPVEFYQDVFPILQNKCLACHSGAVKEGDLILESAELILKGGASGAAVVAGKPDESYLFRVVTRVDEPVMPPLPNKVQAKALTPREVGIFKQWITEGAKAGERQLDTSIAWQPIPESYKAVYSLALDADRRFVYAGRGNRIFVYDLVTGQEASRLSDPQLLSLRQGDEAVYGTGVAHRDFVHSLAISPNGKMLASGGYRVVKLWEKSNPTQLASLALPAKVKGIAVDESGNWGAFLLEDNRIQLWNLANGQPGVIIPAEDHIVTSLAFSPDEKTIVSGTEAGTIRISQISDGATTLGLTIPSAIHAVGAVTGASQLVTAHADHTIRLWNWDDVQVPIAEGAEAKQAILELKGHSQPITVMQVLSSSKELLTGSRDASVKLWSLADGKQLFSQDVGGVVTAVTITADGQHLVGAGENKITRIWNRAGQKIADVQGNQLLTKAVQRSTDDQVVAKAQFALADASLKAAEKDQTEREESLKKANEQKEKVTQELVELEKKATEAKAKVDDAATKLAENTEDAALKKAKEDADKEFATASEALKKGMDAVTSANRAIELSQQSVETAKKSVEQRTQNKTTKEAHQKSADEALANSNAAVAAGAQIVSGVHLTANGKVLITSGAGQPVQLWNLATGAPVGVVEIAVDQLTQTVMTATGSLIAFDAANQATAWDISERWSHVASLGVEPAAPLDVSKSSFEDRITALAFSPDGATLATGGGEPSRNGELKLWHVAEKKLLREIKEAHSDTISDIEFSRDGQFLATGAADKFVKVFHVHDGSLVRSYEGHTDHVLGVSFKADQSSLASAGADKAIKVWNVETGEQSRTISNYGKQVTSIDYIGVTDNMVSCGGDKTVRYHTAANGGNYRSFGGNNDFVYSALSTGDESLVIAAGEDGVVRVWNGKDAKLLMSFDAPAIAAETAQR